MSANGMREGAHDPLEDAVLAAMVASAWGEVPDDAPTSPMLLPLDDIEGNGRGPT